MPGLAQHQSIQTTKMLAVGESGAGKTGMLASLASAGYNLRILDLDNGIDILRALLSDPKYGYSPDSADRVEFESITDKMRSNNSGMLVPAKASVWTRMTKLLMDWKTDTAQFGPVASWTPQDVLVIDNLSRAATAAVNFCQTLNARLGQKMTWDDIYGAQQMLESLAQTLYDDNLRCQVIVLAHPDYIKDQNGIERGLPATVGNKLSPKMGGYFNNMVEVRKGKILTKSSLIEVKISNPGGVKAEYSVKTGLAELFRDLQGHGPVAQIETAKVVPIHQ